MSQRRSKLTNKALVFAPGEAYQGSTLVLQKARQNKRFEKDLTGGVWECGGKEDEVISPRIQLLAEMWAELGIKESDIAQIELVDHYYDVGRHGRPKIVGVYAVYLARLPEEGIQTSEEHSGYSWEPNNHFDQLDIAQWAKDAHARVIGSAAFAAFRAQEFHDPARVA